MDRRRHRPARRRSDLLAHPAARTDRRGAIVARDLLARARRNPARAFRRSETVALATADAPKISDACFANPVVADVLVGWTQNRRRGATTHACSVCCTRAAFSSIGCRLIFRETFAAELCRRISDSHRSPSAVVARTRRRQSPPRNTPRPRGCTADESRNRLAKDGSCFDFEDRPSILRLWKFSHGRPPLRHPRRGRSRRSRRPCKRTSMR